MHICFLNMPIEHYSPETGGAVSTVIMEQAKELISRCHQVTVITPQTVEPSYSVGQVVPIPAVTRDDLSFVQRRISGLRQRWKQWDWAYYEYYQASCLQALAKLAPAPDVVITHNDLVLPKFLRSALPKTKIVAWLHNEQHTKPKAVGKTVEDTDVFVAVSDYIRTWTIERHHIPLQKIVTILNGINLEAFFPRADFLTPSNPLRVLFIGRLDPNKGPDITADAVAALQLEGLPVSLTVAGGLWFYGHGNEMANPFFQKLKPKMDAVQANYLGHVTRDKVPALVREHDVVCVLSRSQEPFGLVILEAMASGCAVIASDRGGLPEACGGAAMLVNPDDLASVIHCLRSLATDAELLQTQKQKSLERAKLASWAGVVDNLEQIVRS